MKYITIGEDNIPALGLGTYGLTGKEGIRTMAEAINMGYRHIDTAVTYYNEPETGEAIAQSEVSRDQLFVTTKLFKDSLITRDHVHNATKDSLKRLQTDYVDLLLIHWPAFDIPIEDTLDAMNELREQGLIRHIGVSNFNVALLKEAVKTGIPIITNQVEYHIFLSQEKLLNAMREQGLFLTAYSPLAKGDIVGHPVLKTIGEKYQKSAVQVALNWLISQEGVAAIPKASSLDKCKSNLDIFDFSLDEEDLNAIAQLEKNKRHIDPPGLSPEWD